MKEKSVLLTLLSVTSNVRYRALINSAIASEKIPETFTEKLKEDNLIRESGNINLYIMTAMGLYYIERKKNLITEGTLVKYLDSKDFNFKETSQDLNDREKIIIFSLISTRAFSLESAMSLENDDFILDTWEEILDSCYEKLYELKIIKKMTKEKIYGKTGNEHPVSNYIRHTDKIPKKTKGIYKAPGSQQYFLDIYKDEKISREHLTYIIKKIFNAKKDGFKTKESREIYEFSKKIAYDKAPYVFDMEDHVFASHEFEEEISNSFTKALLNL